MTPKEKAIEIYESYYYLMPRILSNKNKDITATFCAKKCVDEMLNVISTGSHNETFYKQVKIELTNI